MYFFLVLCGYTMSNVWDRPSSLTVTPTPRRSLPNITTVCPATPPGSDGYQSHLSHINNTIEEFCSLPHLQKTTFVPAIYTFPPWPGVRSLYPNKGEEYPFPDSGVRFAISFSDDKTLEGNCGNGWAFDKTICVEGLKEKWRGGCNITTPRLLPDPATIQAMASMVHQAPPPPSNSSRSKSKRDEHSTSTMLSECVAFHVTSAPPTTIPPSTAANTNTNTKAKERPTQNSFHLDIVYTDSSRFSMDKKGIVCRPERNDLKKKERGWCVCWFEGLEGQSRRFWPANGDMMCWNLSPWVWRPRGQRRIGGMGEGVGEKRLERRRGRFDE